MGGKKKICVHLELIKKKKKKKIKANGKNIKNSHLILLSEIGDQVLC